MLALIVESGQLILFNMPPLAIWVIPAIPLGLYSISRSSRCSAVCLRKRASILICNESKWRGLKIGIELNVHERKKGVFFNTAVRMRRIFEPTAAGV